MKKRQSVKNDIDIFDLQKILDQKEKIEQFFSELLDGMKKIDHPEFPNIDFYCKNKDVYMEHDKINNFLWLSYSLIWSVLQDRFGLSYGEIQSISQDILRARLKIGEAKIFVETGKIIPAWDRKKQWD